MVFDKKEQQSLAHSAAFDTNIYESNSSSIKNHLVIGMDGRLH